MPTKHDKAKLVSTYFNDILAMQVQEVAVDTDVFGTFTGEIERIGTPLETAIKKARAGIAMAGNPFAIASEGSIGPDPILGFVNANIETIVFVDDELDIQVHETIKSNEIIAFTTTTQKMELGKFLKKTDFPNHALIVKPHHGVGAIKGIRTLQELEEAILKSKDASSDGEAIIESDLRAMSSPSRQKNISTVALKLVQRLSVTCPDCQTPGWGRQGFVRGVECSGCGELSEDAIKQEVLGCFKCEYSALGAVINLILDPGRCMSCNP
jgi:hypothetical protein